MNNNHSRKKFQFKGFTNLATILIGSALIIGVIALVSVVINWLQDLIIPWAFEHFSWLFLVGGVILSLSQVGVMFVTLSLIVVLPVTLILLFARRTRRLGAKGLLYTGGVIFGNALSLSIVTTVNLAGVLWLIIGLLFAGIGVIPIAFVAALIRSEWVTALTILAGCVIGGALCNFSNSLVEKSTNRTAEAVAAMEELPQSKH
jgi:hypothetical protein